MNTWSSQDSTAARAQGWDVYEIWENGLQYEVQKNDDSTTFSTDEAARSFVRTRAADSPQRDALCHKAWVIVFKSKLGVPSVKPKRKKR